MPTLDELDPPAWGDAPADATSLVERCHRLRTVPIDDLAAGDLRVLIGQSIGLEVLVPRALEIVASAPLIEASYYPGDLLCALLELPTEYWVSHPDEHHALSEIASSINFVAEAVSVFLDQPLTPE